MSKSFLKLGPKASSVYNVHVRVGKDLVDMKAYCKLHSAGLEVVDSDLSSETKKMVADGILDLVTTGKGMVKEVVAQVVAVAPKAEVKPEVKPEVKQEVTEEPSPEATKPEKKEKKDKK